MSDFKATSNKPLFHNEISAWTPDKLDALSATEKSAFAHKFDPLGIASGEAQHLTGPISSTEKLLSAQAREQQQVLLVICRRLPGADLLKHQHHLQLAQAQLQGHAHEQGGEQGGELGASTTEVCWDLSTPRDTDGQEEESFYFEPVGYLKYGRKDLYFFHGARQELHRGVLCLLDFFVSPSMQRLGLGRTLFQTMLQTFSRADGSGTGTTGHYSSNTTTSNLSKSPDMRGGLWSATEQAVARRVAYDRPSPLLLAFLQRHLDMTGGELQPNRFTIFRGFFV